MTVIGRDINPVAIESVRVSLGAMNAALTSICVYGFGCRRWTVDLQAIPFDGFARASMRSAVLFLGNAGALSRLPWPIQSLPVVGHRQKRIP